MKNGIAYYVGMYCLLLFIGAISMMFANGEFSISGLDAQRRVTIVGLSVILTFAKMLLDYLND